MSLKITFDLDNVTPAEARAIHALADALTETLSPKPNSLPPMVVKVADGATMTAKVGEVPEVPPPAAPAPTPEAEKPKRGRPRKDASGAQPVAPASPESTPSAPAAVGAATEAAPGPQTGSADLKPISLDDLRAKLQAFAEAKGGGEAGMDAAAEILGRFGAVRVSELTSLPVEKQHEFLAACDV